MVTGHSTTELSVTWEIDDTSVQVKLETNFKNVFLLYFIIFLHQVIKIIYI